SHLTAMGGSYPAIRQCIQAKEPMIRGVIGCQSNQLSGACGLALPPDNVLVQTTKQCAIRQGFNTPAVQQICRCFANAGVRRLAPLCSKMRAW
ncbi:hypothetical protein TELCIR_18345, partial [Teladorsagia circumcincta]